MFTDLSDESIIFQGKFEIEVNPSHDINSVIDFCFRVTPGEVLIKEDTVFEFSVLNEGETLGAYRLSIGVVHVSR